MSSFTPVPGKVELSRRLLAAFVVKMPTEKYVIEVDVKGPVRVYVKGFAQYEDMPAVCEAFEVYAVKDVTVADDATVTVEAR